MKTNSIAAPLDDEDAVVKKHVNAFLETDPKQKLDAAGIEEVIVIGAMSHTCIDAAVRAASDLDCKTTVVQDACATRDLEYAEVTVPTPSVHAAMMSALGFAYAAIVDTENYLSSCGPSVASQVEEGENSAAPSGVPCNRLGSFSQGAGLVQDL